MRRKILSAALAGAVATISTEASAAGYGYCWTRGNGVDLVSPLFAWGDAEDFGMKAESNWKYFVWKNYKAEVKSRGDCSKQNTEASAREFRSKLLNNIRRDNSKYRLELVDYVPVKPFARLAVKDVNRKPAAEKRSESAEKGKFQVPQAAELKTQMDAERQARLDKYAAEKAAWEAKIAEQKAEEARQRAIHAAAQEEARKAQSLHETKMEAHRREVANAQRRREEWLAIKRRHDNCMAGDRQACADMAAGAPTGTERLADSAKPSTDTDANRCVTTAEVRINATFQGNTSASVLNGCAKPVDIRICLKRDNDWNCGVKWGVAPQQQGVHSSFNATGEVFVDARTTGSSRALAGPPN